MCLNRWPNTTLQQLQRQHHLGPADTVEIVAMLTVGAVAGALLCGCFQWVYGEIAKKPTLAQRPPLGEVEVDPELLSPEAKMIKLQGAAPEGYSVEENETPLAANLARLPSITVSWLCPQLVLWTISACTLYVRHTMHHRSIGGRQDQIGPLNKAGT